MRSKSIFYVLSIAGSIVGGYLPALFGVSTFSFTSLITSAIGGIAGIYIAYKMTR